MALKAVHVSEVPSLDQVPETSSALLSASRLARKGPENVRMTSKTPKFVVIGHRGRGMNALASSDRRLKAIMENTVLSFNEAARFPVDFVEFDVQVTRDGCPIIFHDDFILAEEDGTLSEKRVTDLELEEFLAYGHQPDAGKVGKSLLRRNRDGTVVRWTVETQDPLCTLQDVFRKVDTRLGFNVELKFDDHYPYSEEELTRSLQATLQVVCEFANDRPIIFSSFQPDAARLMRKLQTTYPVFFLTNGGDQVYADERRNSLEEAVKHCLDHGLQGIVSEARGLFRNPTLIPRIKESKLGLLTYGQLNNVAEAVYMQHLMGVDGVIVDLVQEITEAVSGFAGSAADGDGGPPAEEGEEAEEEGTMSAASRPRFSRRELSFLLRLMPELVQH